LQVVVDGGEGGVRAPVVVAGRVTYSGGVLGVGGRRRRATAPPVRRRASRAPPPAPALAPRALFRPQAPPTSAVGRHRVKQPLRQARPDTHHIATYVLTHYPAGLLWCALGYKRIGSRHFCV